jgi:VanZ family protein
MTTWLEKRKITIPITILIAIEIFFFSSIPGTAEPLQVKGLDLTVIYHFGIFFLFGFFCLVSIKGDKKLTGSGLSFVLIISLIYAALDEIHQKFVPMRVSSLQDFLIDSSGILISFLFFLFLNNKNNPKSIIEEL